MGFSLIHKSNTWPRKRRQLNGIVRHAHATPPHSNDISQQLWRATFHCSTLACFAYFRLPFLAATLLRISMLQFLWQTFPIFICIPCRQDASNRGYVRRLGDERKRHRLALSYIFLGICMSCMPPAFAQLILFSLFCYFFEYLFFCQNLFTGAKLL